MALGAVRWGSFSLILTEVGIANSTSGSVQCRGDFVPPQVQAFRTALYKRGKPARLYFDNGSNYRSNVILKACLRLGIHLAHAPIRDGAAKGKIERFFRAFRDRFLTAHTHFDSLASLNQKTAAYIEADYNNQHHSGIQMKPIDRFNLDIRRVHYLQDDQYGNEVFLMEADRKVDTRLIVRFAGQNKPTSFPSTPSATNAPPIYALKPSKCAMTSALKPSWSTTATSVWVKPNRLI